MVSSPRVTEIAGAGTKRLDIVAARLLAAAGEQRVWLLQGPMGIGKTTLVQALGRQLGVREAITSPTFALVNEYVSPTGPVYHFDFYRLRYLAEALEIGVEDYFYSGCYCFIEWPELVEPIVPPRHIHVNIEPGEGDTRMYKLTHHER